MALTKPNEEFAGVFVFVFAANKHILFKRPACYIRRGGKRSAGCEAKVTISAETSRSAATTAGSQVHSTAIVCSFAFSRKGKNSLLLTS